MVEYYFSRVYIEEKKIHRENFFHCINKKEKQNSHLYSDISYTYSKNSITSLFSRKIHSWMKNAISSAYNTVLEKQSREKEISRKTMKLNKFPYKQKEKSYFLST